MMGRVCAKVCIFLVIGQLMIYLSSLDFGCRFPITFNHYFFIFIATNVIRGVVN